MKKVFVEVNVKFSSDGQMTPESFVWENGVNYEIDRVYECKNAASMKVGGRGVRYSCRVMGKEIYLFLEDGRWFMEGK